MTHMMLPKLDQCNKPDKHPKSGNDPQVSAVWGAQGTLPSGKGLEQAGCCRELSDLVTQEVIASLSIINSARNSSDFFTNPKGIYCDLDTLMTAAIFLLLLALHLHTEVLSRISCSAKHLY